MLISASCSYVGPEPFSDYVGPQTAAPWQDESESASTPSDLLPPTGPLNLGVEEAVRAALFYNQSLAVETVTPAIRRTFERQLAAVFDPVVSASAAYDHERISGDNINDRTERGLQLDGGASIFLPTGTTIGADAITQRESPAGVNDRYATRLGLSMSQALLRGAGEDVNLVPLRQARLDTLISQYELRGFVLALVGQVQVVYWNYTLAQQQIEIFEKSLELAEQQLRDTQERIRIGRLPETEEAAAQAEVARRRESLINARSILATLRVRLLRLVNPPGDTWDRVIVPKDLPIPPRAQLDDVEAHVRLALRIRPEINQAKLLINRSELEIVRTRNGLLPRLDLFATLGKSGYAASFGSSAGDLFAEPSYDVLAGVRMEFPPLNRSARAEHDRSQLTRRQAQESLDNLRQLVQVDVREAYIEVQRLGEQVVATAATQGLQEEVYRAEVAKYAVGRSTSFLVGQAQRDLLASQIAHAQAIVGYLNSLVELYRLDGSLLERLGISAPGAIPPEEATLY